VLGLRKTKRPRGLRLFFATDIHGSESCFRKFLNAGAFYDVSVLILGGDIVGKLLIPITDHGSGCYSAHYGEHRYDDLDAKGLERLTAEIRRSGHYYLVAGPETLAELEDEHERDRVFRQVVCKSIADWVELAEERLRGTGRRVFVAPGNDDFFDIDAALQGSDVVEFAEARCVSVDGFDMITTGFSNPTPWETDRELPEPDLRARIEAMARDARSGAELIAVLHAPPINTSLDQAPALNADFRPAVGAGGLQMAAVGSTAVREFIEEHQPLVSLHGHVHEGKGVAQIGRTLCINPGSEYTQGVLSGALVELGDHEVLSHQFVTG
jgi:uncharacterized protein